MAACRVAGVRCLGLAALHATAGFRLGASPSLEQMLPPSMLRAAAQDPAAAVRIAAAEALSDLAIAR